MLQKRNLIFFYRSDILDEKAMQRKGPTKFFLKSQVSQIQKEHKMSIPIKKISSQKELSKELLAVAMLFDSYYCCLLGVGVSSVGKH